VGVAPDREVGELLGLAGGGLGQLAAAVAHLHGEQARQAVEVALAVLVPDVRALAPHDGRHLVVGVARQPGEVHPQMAARLVVEAGGVGQGSGRVGHRVPHV
jgi:hypothetical protein